MKLSSLKHKKVVLLFSGILAAALLVLGYRELKLKKEPSEFAETSQYIAAQINTDEQPVILKVQDPSALPKLDFYTSAKSGDLIYVYEKSNKIVLFDSQKQKISKTETLNTLRDPAVLGSSDSLKIQADKDTDVRSQEDTDPLTIEIYNTSSVPDLASIFELRLEKDIPFEYTLTGSKELDLDIHRTSVTYTSTDVKPYVELISSSMNIPIIDMPEQITSKADIIFILK